MNPVCPLIKSSEVSLIEKFSVKDLVSLYYEFPGIDIESELKDYREIGFYHCAESDIKFFYPLVSGSEDFYEKLQQFDWYYMNEKYEYTYASKFIKESDHLLEIGCGNGFFAQKISVQKYVGLEFSQKAQLTAQNQGLTVLNETIKEHSVNNSSKYNVVCAFQVLEHISDINSFIENSLECLVPGGLLIYSVPNADSFIATTKNPILNMPPHHLSWWSTLSLKYVAKLFNLNIVDINYEKLADIHKTWYASTIILKAIENLLNLKNKKSLIDRSISFKLLSKISAFGGMFLAKGFSNLAVLPQGHSVTIVYQKKEKV